jgi:hypothetical protein
MTNSCPLDATVQPLCTNPRSRYWCIGLVLLIWAISWCLSVISFYIMWGVLPAGVDEWLWWPLLTSVISLPGSAGRLTLDLFSWVSPGGQRMFAGLTMVAFWPCYITLLVLWVRKGKLMHFAFFAAMSLFASIYWHILSVGMSGI